VAGVKAIITAVLLATTGVAVASEPCDKVLAGPVASVKATKKAPVKKRINNVSTPAKPRKALPVVKRQPVQCDPTASAGQNKFIAAATTPLLEPARLPATHGLPSAMDELDRAKYKPEEGMRIRDDDRPVYAQVGNVWDIGLGFYGFGYGSHALHHPHRVAVETKPRPSPGNPDGEVPIPGTMFLIGLGIFLLGRFTFKQSTWTRR
jgi:hypothetical protein